MPTLPTIMVLWELDSFEQGGIKNVKPISEGCAAILRRLLDQRRIGGKHIPEVLCLRWIKHLQKKEHKIALKDWGWCIKEGLVVVKPTSSGRHVFLNPRRLREILKLVE